MPPTDGYETLIIEDGPVPLAMMPQTGLESAVGLLTTGIIFSAFIAACASTAIRKLKQEQTQA